MHSRNVSKEVIVIDTVITVLLLFGPLAWEGQTHKPLEWRQLRGLLDVALQSRKISFFLLSLLPLSSQLDELTKIKPGKYLGLFPGARSGGWLRETGRSAGKSKALQRQVALPSWCCCRSPHRCRAELCSPGPGSLPLASFLALCACYLLVTTWLLQF